MDNARLYAHSNGLQKRDALVALREFLPQMEWKEDGETVLDVGCGSGDVTTTLLVPLLPEGVRKVVGVDVSKEMVDFASKNFHHNLVEYRQVDIVNDINPWQMFPEGFTKITSFYCLHWIRDQAACLSNMFHMLQAGGEALLVFLASNPIFTMYENLSQNPRWKMYMLDVSNFIPQYQYKEQPAHCMTQYAVEAGFEVQFCEAPDMSFPFENLNYLKKAVTAVNPFLNRIPNNEKDDFVNDCLQELVKICPQDNYGGTIANYKLMIAYLKKPNKDNEQYFDI